MIKKQKTYKLLIFLTLISFGFFGSLSHIFTLTLIIFSISYDYRNIKKSIFNFRSLILYFMLSGCFFIFLFNSFFFGNFGASIQSLSPMLPLPLIGLLILFQKTKNFDLSSQHLSKFSQISILIAVLIYISFSLISESETSYFKIYSNDRLMLFSGNPIPFSFVMLGISIFCVADWRNSNNTEKLNAIVFFTVGIFMAGFLSGTRSTLLAILFIAPLFIFYIFTTLYAVFTLAALAAFSCLFWYLHANGFLASSYLTRIQNGFTTFSNLSGEDAAIADRLEMWSAATRAIREAPIFGYNITERFEALKPYLRNSVTQSTHPHNDILASIISSGFLGGLAAVCSLVSGFLASLFTRNRSSEKKYFGLMLTFSTLFTANVSTVLFNDITCAWLAFSTYLIWSTNFEKTN